MRVLPRARVPEPTAFQIPAPRLLQNLRGAGTRLSVLAFVPTGIGRCVEIRLQIVLACWRAALRRRPGEREGRRLRNTGRYSLTASRKTGPLVHAPFYWRVELPQIKCEWPLRHSAVWKKTVAGSSRIYIIG